MYIICIIFKEVWLTRYYIRNSGKECNEGLAPCAAQQRLTFFKCSKKKQQQQKKLNIVSKLFLTFNIRATLKQKSIRWDEKWRYAAQIYRMKTRTKKTHAQTFSFNLHFSTDKFGATWNLTYKGYFKRSIEFQRLDEIIKALLTKK